MSLNDAGVLVHVLDNNEDAGSPWLPCPSSTSWCAPYNDRFSCSIISKDSPADVNGEIPLFKSETGFILSPSAMAPAVRCSYSGDGGTMSKTGGCGGGWCSPSAPTGSCAWHPTDLGPMMSQYKHTNQRYNEVIIDASKWVSRLPATIEAVYFVAGSASSEQKARAVHKSFTKKYGAGSAKHVRFDQSNWEYPFEPIDD